MTGDHPKISVCIPTYNRAGYLREALDSILRQTLQDFEIVVCDDASTDDTRQLVASIGDDRLRYFRQPRNVGIAENRNLCLQMARGSTWLARLGRSSSPGDAARQSAVLDRNPTVGLVHGGCRLSDSKAALSGLARAVDHDTIEAGRDAFRELILGNYIMSPSVMARRTCFDRVGKYDVELAITLRIGRCGFGLRWLPIWLIQPNRGQVSRA